MLNVNVIQNTAQWDSRKSLWDEITIPHFNRGFDWLRSWWDAYRSDHELMILEAVRDGNVLGFLPLARHRSLFTGDTLVWLGSGKACSDNMGLVCQPEDEYLVAETFAGFLAAPTHRSYRWDHIDLDGVRPQDPGMNVFLDKLIEGCRPSLERRVSLNCWELSLTESFPNYLASVSKRVRKMYQESEQHQSRNCVFEIADSLPRAMQLFEQITLLHQARWKERGIRGCFSRQSFGSFLKNALDRYWVDERTHPIVAVLHIDGKPGGGAIAFVHDRTLSVYLTGMDTEYSDYRPGWQTSFGLIQHAISLGCTKVDFMRGDEEYKERLGARRTPQERWIIASSQWGSQIRHATYKTAVQLKNWTGSLVGSLSTS
jgi:CelD/BcsL family acetyltransferase involved in cellulose biosynthesis